MSYEGKNSLIYQLYKEVVGKTEKKEESRFSSNTNTLYANGVMKKNSDVQIPPKKDCHEIALEKNEYSNILKGSIKFWIMYDNGIHINDDLIIRECENFRQTGRFVSKHIIYVARSSEFPGLKENYIAVGWE